MSHLANNLKLYMFESLRDGNMIRYILNQIIIYHYLSLKFSLENYFPLSQFNLTNDSKQ